MLRAGALAAPIYFVEERTIGPSLGAENIRPGVNSLITGFVLVMVFMIAVYRGFGVIANVALAVNLVLLVAIMSLLQAVLTLPGIAGIVLTVGMAVDANVLIFSRIREERARGLADPQAVRVGFERAFVTILDSNITTLLVAIILAGIGSGPVKGFAITLAIGICTSLFTATLVTRLLTEGIIWSSSSTKVGPVSMRIGTPAIDFMAGSPSLLIIILGGRHLFDRTCCN